MSVDWVDEEDEKRWAREAADQDVSRDRILLLMNEMWDEAESSGLSRWGDGSGGEVLEWCKDEARRRWPPVVNRSTPAEKERNKVTPKQTIRIFRRDGFACQHCGIHDDLTIDHIVPVIAGGLSRDENLQTLCKSCNSRKGAR